MADIFYIPPRQKAAECRYLEKNYISCILQKALKDRISSPVCDLSGVIYFHIECPAYVKKFDAPDAKEYLKRQVFSLLMLPYIQSKMFVDQLNFININSVKDKHNNMRHIKYPEELDTTFNYEKTDVDNGELFKKHKEFYTYNANFIPGMTIPLTNKLPGTPAAGSVNNYYY